MPYGQLSHRGTLRWLLLWGVAFAAFVLPAAASGANHDDEIAALVAAGVIDPAVAQSLSANGSAEAIILLDDTAARDAATASRATSRDEIRARRLSAYRSQKQALRSLAGPGMTVLADYSNMGSLFVRFDSAAALAAAGANARTTAIVPNTAPQLLTAETLDLIDQPQAALSGYGGNGVTVAVIDSGIDYYRPHFGCSETGLAQLTCRVISVLEFDGDGETQLDEAAVAYHGTNVAGIVSAVAPQARLIGLDICAGTGCADANGLAAIDWVLDHADEYNIRAVNLSIGANEHWTNTCPDSPYRSAFQNLRDEGIVPVVAAGNFANKNGNSLGPYIDGLAMPACTPGAFSVGATYDSSGTVYTWSGYCAPNQVFVVNTPVCFSQSSPGLDLYAPGARTRVAGQSHDGTSQAAPHVAGAVAVIAAAKGSLTANQIENALRSNGPIITDARAGGRQTHLLDVCAALDDALVTVTNPCVGSPGNDDRADALRMLESPYFHRVSTNHFTTEASDPVIACTISQPPQQSHSAWYKLSTGTAGFLTVTTENSVYNTPNSSADPNTILAIFEGGGLNPVACNDDAVFDGGSAGGKLARLQNVALLAGKTYYIEVTAAGSNPGGYLVLNAKFTGTLTDGSEQSPGVTKLSIPGPVPNKPAGVPVGDIMVMSADSQGALVTSDNTTQVAVSLSPAGAIACTYNDESEPLTKTVTSGVAIWHNCVVDAPGDFTIVATPVAGAILPAESNAFVITDPGFDATCNGSIASDDALATLLAIAELDPGPTLPCTGDADHDTALTLSDVLLIRRRAAGIE